MISNKEVKRSFKVVLDSYNTNSFIAPDIGGQPNQYNANYYVDLKTIINDESAFDKQYNVYCEFLTMAETPANNNINLGALYTMQLHFAGIGGINSYQYEPTKYYNFILPVQNLYDSTNTLHTLLRLDQNGQKPMFLQNIRNMTNIYLQVFRSDTTSQPIFSPAIPNNSKYICILTFIEA